MKRIFVAFLALIAFSGVAWGLNTPLFHKLKDEQSAITALAREYTVSISGVQISDGKGNLVSAKSARTWVGSGFIISRDGLVITNKHVADAFEFVEHGINATAVYTFKMTLSNGKMYDATLIGIAGTGIDLALMRIKNPPTGLTIATLADSENVKVGQFVFAVGSPLGLKDSTSAGIVSSAAAYDALKKDLFSFIQTDAAINHGNSGGPLVNIDAEVIGVNTAIAATSDDSGSIGIGFAIPSKVVKQFLAGAQSKPRESGWVGIVVDALDAQTRMMFGIDPSIEGVRVMTIDRRSPGIGKIVTGDIIVDIDAEKVLTQADWKRLIILKGEGSAVKIGIMRNGKRIEVSIKLGKVPTP